MSRHEDRTPGAKSGEGPVVKAMVAVMTAHDWSPKVLRDRLLAYYDKVGTDLNEVDFNVVPSEATVRRMRDNLTIPTRDFAWFIEKWLEDSFPDELALQLRISDYPFVSLCRTVLGRKLDPEPGKMEKFAGHYALYRPFHLKPRSKLIVERFSVSLGGNPFACELSARYPHITPHDGTDSRGMCVPHGNKLMALLTVESDSYSQIVIYIDRVHSDNLRRERGEPKIIAMTGIMLASVGSADDASAWPVYLERVEKEEDVELRVVDGIEIERLPALGQRSLQRGSVYWSAEDWGRPFGNLV